MAGVSIPGRPGLRFLHGRGSCFWMAGGPILDGRASYLWTAGAPISGRPVILFLDGWGTPSRQR
eukprot:scaffold4334_cov118-Isochrysis_galbana.AAC.1